ncbi:hypothetical protein H4582DRAFT_1298586 [Lactarius indigo]|nr:hypothetical protein H4582DRAFT_1298586 [Lactarius indigo]
MVDWHKPTTILAERVAVINLAHVISGIYIWEIVLCLGFEYSVIMKKRKFKWSFPLYLGCRWFPLFSITFQLLALDVSHKIDCQTCVVLAFMFAYLSFMCASALIILRIAVLWDYSKIVIPFSLYCMDFQYCHLCLQPDYSPLNLDWILCNLADRIRQAQHSLHLHHGYNTPCPHADRPQALETRLEVIWRLGAPLHPGFNMGS